MSKESRAAKRVKERRRRERESEEVTILTLSYDALHDILQLSQKYRITDIEEDDDQLKIFIRGGTKDE